MAYLVNNFLNLLTTVVRKVSYWGLKNIVTFIFYELIYYFKFNSKTLFGVRNKELDYELKKEEEFIEYIPTPYFLLYKSLKKINLKIADISLVDFGSGAGRVLEFFIDRNIKFAKGVEMSKNLTNISKLNLSKYDNVVILNIDAQDYRITQEDNLFFLYDPFGAETVKKVIKNINNSLKEKSRKINIIYISPRHRDYFETNFRIIYKDINKYNLGIVIYSN